MTDDVTNDDNTGVTVVPGTAPITVVVDSEQDTGEPALLAGKFKTPEDLEKAYKELESKLGATNKGVGDDSDTDDTAGDNADSPDGDHAVADADAPANSDGNKDAGEGNEDPYAAYGEVVGNALKEAEVDPTAAAEEFEKNGTLADETFEKFEKAGFSREFVEAYLRGVTATRATQTAATEEQIAQIKAVAGGEEGFTKLQAWMAANVPHEDLEAYNEAVGSGDVNKAAAAVAAMNTRYKAEIGTEGKLIGGKTPAQQAYASEAEMLEDMAKPEYKTSQAFRDKVAAKIQASAGIFQTR
jgi:hypothetical protein